MGLYVYRLQLYSVSMCVYMYCICVYDEYLQLKMFWVRKRTDLPVLQLSFLFSVTHEQLKERGLFGLPPPPGTNPTDYYHLMANHRSPYGELLMQTSAAAAATAVHLPDYISPVDSEYPLTIPQHITCSI